MKALGVTRIVGASYFRGEINELFASYFEEAGIEVLEMAGMDVDFNRAQFLSEREVYGFARALFLRHSEAEGIYLLGSGWQVLDMVQMLEDDMGVPVIHAVTARIWAFEHRLHVREKIAGYGRLLSELPRPV
jgi:maleate isomerase